MQWNEFACQENKGSLNGFGFTYERCVTKLMWFNLCNFLKLPILFEGILFFFVVWSTTCLFYDFVSLLEFFFLLPKHKVMYSLRLSLIYCGIILVRGGSMFVDCVGYTHPWR